jgi:hypothetical protein
VYHDKPFIDLLVSRIREQYRVKIQANDDDDVLVNCKLEIDEPFLLINKEGKTNTNHTEVDTIAAAKVGNCLFTS